MTGGSILLARKEIRTKDRFSNIQIRKFEPLIFTLGRNTIVEMFAMSKFEGSESLGKDTKICNISTHSVYYQPAKSQKV